MYLIWIDMPFCVSNYAWGIILSDYSHKKWVLLAVKFLCQ